MLNQQKTQHFIPQNIPAIWYVPGRPAVHAHIEAQIMYANTFDFRNTVNVKLFSR